MAAPSGVFALPNKDLPAGQTFLVASSAGTSTVGADLPAADATMSIDMSGTNGQVILMHDWPANTVAAIPRIAQGLAARNLCAGMISPQTGRAVAPTVA